MADDRERFTKVITLAMHPTTMDTEALAAFRRARELAKANPSLAHPPSAPAPASAEPPQIESYNARITSVHPDWILILVELLSKRAYELELKYQITFDFSNQLTAVKLVWSGPDKDCQGLQSTVEWAVNYINNKLKES